MRFKFFKCPSRIIFVAMKGNFAKGWITLFSLIFISYRGNSQTLGIKMNATDLGKGKVRISWFNPFRKLCTQLSVQESFDSTRFFHTILTAQSPELPDNGFVYTSPNSGRKMFYRIFYVLDNGDYFFTKSSAASTFNNQTTATIQEETAVPEEVSIDDIPFLSKKRRVNADIINSSEYSLQKNMPPSSMVKPAEKNFVHLYFRKRDSLIQIMEYGQFRIYRDSIANKTKDTLYALNKYDVVLLPYVPKYVWKPSVYVVLNQNGYINIRIPGAHQKTYRLVFFDTDGSVLFEIKRVKEPNLILDKTNFLHSGWFNFELYEEDKLKEKNKVYLEKDF